MVLTVLRGQVHYKPMKKIKNKNRNQQTKICEYYFVLICYECFNYCWIFFITAVSLPPTASSYDKLDILHIFISCSKHQKVSMFITSTSSTYVFLFNRTSLVLLFPIVLFKDSLTEFEPIHRSNEFQSLKSTFLTNG